MRVLCLDFGKTKRSERLTVKGGCLQYNRGRTACRELADSKGEKDKKRSKDSLGYQDLLLLNWQCVWPWAYYLFWNFFPFWCRLLKLFWWQAGRYFSEASSFNDSELASTSSNPSAWFHARTSASSRFTHNLVLCDRQCHLLKRVTAECGLPWGILCSLGGRKLSVAVKFAAFARAKHILWWLHVVIES